MLTSQLTLRQILADPNRQYYCPPIQREYVWGKELLEELWSDLENLRQDGGNSHFMGTVIVSAGEDVVDDKGRLEYESCMLIDGQQRLTSFFLLLWAAYERLTSSGAPSHVKAVNKLRNCLTMETPDVLKLKPTLVDLDAFKDILSGDTKRGRRRIHQAWSFFKDKVASLHDLEHLVELVEAALNKAQFAVVSLTEDEDPCTFFAAANGKSQPLTATDLIKNLLLMKSGEADLLQAERKLWQPFADGLPSATVSMLMLTAHDVRCGWDDRAKVHRNLGKQIRDLGAAAFFEDLQTWKAAYLWVVDARFDGGRQVQAKLRSAARRIKQHTTFFAPKAHFIWMLPVRKYLEGEITDTQLKDCLELIENYAIRLFGEYGTVLSYWTRDTNAPRLLGLAGDDFADAFKKVLVAHPDYRMSRTDEQLKQFVTKLRISKGATQQWAAAVLLGIEMRSHGDLLPHEPTVEHILPQKWQKEPDWLGCFNPVEDERLPLLLGNLTIASSDPNTQMGNGPWATKRLKLIESSFRMNRELAAIETWNREAIELRTGQLADAVCRCWPHLA